jgi:hypothetical protein
MDSIGENTENITSQIKEESLMKMHITQRIGAWLLTALALLAVAVLPAASQPAATGEVPETADFCLTTIEAGTHHIGDTVVDEWEVPNPEGPVWTKTFNSPIFDQVVIRFETYEANRANVLINGQNMLRLGGETQNWKYHAILIDREMLVSSGNKIRFQTDVEPERDDFMLRNVGLVTCYSVIEVGAHHLGDTSRDYWLLPSPAGTSWSVTFPLSVSIPGTSLLTADVYDNTSPFKVEVNGSQAGSMLNGTPEVWKTQAVVIDGTLLNAQGNTIVLTPGAASGDGGSWDDVIFKNLRLYYETRSADAIYLPQLEK